MTDLRNLTCEAEGGVRANLARLVYLQRNLYSRADDEYGEALQNAVSSE